MEKFILVLFVFLAGGAMSIQASVNGTLGKKIGSIEGAFVSFFIGTLALCIIMLFFGKGNIVSMFRVPKWNLLGGLLGALYVGMSVLSVPKLGVGTTIVTAIVGQIAISMVLDHFGLFGNPRISLGGSRLLGLFLLFIALYLIFKGGSKAI
ncbi:DMT family transporter [Bacillus songklensis]|uniref:DMT family transporter n=1 Tax=Bacillus songklensis TaxID=1069116 RepID=A0ABV8B5H3_9BACI